MSVGTLIQNLNRPTGLSMSINGKDLLTTNNHYVASYSIIHNISKTIAGSTKKGHVTGPISSSRLNHLHNVIELVPGILLIAEDNNLRVVDRINGVTYIHNCNFSRYAENRTMCEEPLLTFYLTEEAVYISRKGITTRLEGR